MEAKPEFYDSKDIPLHDFIFVGCWNLPGPARNMVAHDIVNHPTAQTIILGGDNVYPVAGDKGFPLKVHRTQTFYDGIKLYMEKGKTVLGTLGNHNIALALNDKTRVVDMKKRQMKVFGMHNSYYITEFQDRCCVVVLDTNLREDDYTQMCKWLETALHYIQRNGLSYYIVQHEPFFSVKGSKKEGVLKIKYQLWEPRRVVMDILFTFPPICVLCADTHNYQTVEIVSLTDPSQSILQLVVGTGGASHDEYGLKKPYEDDAYRYEVIYPKKEEQFISAYGYIHIRSPHEYKFMPVKGWMGGVRSRNRTLKRRTRKNDTLSSSNYEYKKI
jgi:hypothetical protein